MRKNTISVLIAGVMLGGCASPLPLIDFYEADSEALRNYRNILVLAVDDGGDAAFEDLGEVEGLYCNRTQAFGIMSDEAKRSAIDQVKLRAAAEGADAISAPACESRTTWDLTNNCYSTLVCRSRAFANPAD